MPSVVPRGRWQGSAQGPARRLGGWDQHPTSEAAKPADSKPQPDGKETSFPSTLTDRQHGGGLPHWVTLVQIALQDTSASVPPAEGSAARKRRPQSAKSSSLQRAPLWQSPGSSSTPFPARRQQLPVPGRTAGAAGAEGRSSKGGPPGARPSHAGSCCINSWFQGGCRAGRGQRGKQGAVGRKGPDCARVSQVVFFIRSTAVH